MVNRRGFLAMAAGAAVAGCRSSGPRVAGGCGCGRGKTEWLAFSRVFQQFGCERAAELLKTAGYTGVEWTIRPGGFVEPGSAVRDFPKAVAAARRFGLSCDNAIVSFLDPFEGKNLDILKAAADNGVKAYRPAYYKYDLNESAEKSLDRIRRGFDRHEKAARETGLRMLYQNHSTYDRSVALFGSLCWDLWEVVKDHDPAYIGVQYDYMHARAEQGPSWQRGLSLLGPWIGTLCLKDFAFAMDLKHPGDWKRVLLPPGEGGICDWKEFKSICDREGIRAPYTIHYDYPTGPGDVYAAADYDLALKNARRDLDRFKAALA